MVMEITNYASSNLGTNTNAIVVELGKLRGYLNNLRLSATAYYKWAEEMENSKHRDREAMGGDNCPRSDSVYANQKNAANKIQSEATTYITQLDAAINAAQDVSDTQSVASGDGGYQNAAYQNAADLLAGVGEGSDQKSSKTMRTALIVGGLLVFGFVVFKLVKK